MFAGGAQKLYLRHWVLPARGRRQRLKNTGHRYAQAETMRRTERRRVMMSASDAE